MDDEKRQELPEIKLAMKREEENILMIFSQDISWVSFNALSALRVAEELKRLAEDILNSDA